MRGGLERWFAWVIQCSVVLVRCVSPACLTGSCGHITHDMQAVGQRYQHCHTQPYLRPVLVGLTNIFNDIQVDQTSLINYWTKIYKPKLIQILTHCVCHSFGKPSYPVLSLNTGFPAHKIEYTL